MPSKREKKLLPPRTELLTSFFGSEYKKKNKIRGKNKTTNRVKGSFEKIHLPAFVSFVGSEHKTRT